MQLVVALSIGSYLLGSIPAGYIAGRLAGVDIRKVGSGNVGATNVTRSLGKAYGYAVFAFDFLKGLVAVSISILLAERIKLGIISPELAGITAAVCAVLGHSFPIWLAFKGGKGVATSAGALFGLMPLAALIGVIIWITTFQLTRYVSLASILAAISLPLIVLLISLGNGQGKLLFYFSLGLAAVVVLRHSSNISRLLHGTEPRFNRK